MDAKTTLRLAWLAAPAAAAFAAGALAASGGSDAPRWAPVVAPSSIVDSPRPQVVEETLLQAPRRRQEPRLQRGKPLPDPFEDGRF